MEVSGLLDVESHVCRIELCHGVLLMYDDVLWHAAKPGEADARLDAPTDVAFSQISLGLEHGCGLQKGGSDEGKPVARTKSGRLFFGAIPI